MNSNNNTNDRMNKRKVNSSHAVAHSGTPGNREYPVAPSSTLDPDEISSPIPKKWYEVI